MIEFAAMRAELLNTNLFEIESLSTCKEEMGQRPLLLYLTVCQVSISAPNQLTILTHLNKTLTPLESACP